MRRITFPNWGLYLIFIIQAILFGCTSPSIMAEPTPLTYNQPMVFPIGQIIATEAIVRESASYTSTIIQRLPVLTMVSIIDEQNNWRKIKTIAPPDITGWISSDFIATDLATTGVNRANVSLYSGPGIHYAKITNLNSLTRLAITGQFDNCAWLQVKLSGMIEGWVLGQDIERTVGCDQIPIVSLSAQPAVDDISNKMQSPSTLNDHSTQFYAGQAVVSTTTAPTSSTVLQPSSTPTLQMPPAPAPTATWVYPAPTLRPPSTPMIFSQISPLATPTSHR